MLPVSGLIILAVKPNGDAIPEVRYSKAGMRAVIAVF